jgi:hypothetical protein
MNLLKTLPVNLATAFFKIATWAHILAAVGIIGSVAQSVANQPLLNVAFGQERGAALALAAIAISHAATTITAYSAPIGGAVSTVVVPVAATHTETTTTTTT